MRAIRLAVFALVVIPLLNRISTVAGRDITKDATKSIENVQEAQQLQAALSEHLSLDQSTLVHGPLYKEHLDPQQPHDLTDPRLATVFAANSSLLLPHLHEPPAEFDLNKSTLLAHFSSIAYCADAESISSWTCGRCAPMSGYTTHSTVFDKSWNVFGFVGMLREQRAVVVAFRGTDSTGFTNWYENMHTWRTDLAIPSFHVKGVLIHSGFHRLWARSALRHSVGSAVSDLLEQCAGCSLWVTGHSMGGAIATLAALDLKAQFNIQDVAVHTFGSPRVGNSAFHTLFLSSVSESLRFTHNRDIVPSVPLELMGFHHVAREIWEVDVAGDGGSARRYLNCNGSGEDKHCHAGACYLGLCTSVADHMTYLGEHMFRDEGECAAQQL